MFAYPNGVLKGGFGMNTKDIITHHTTTLLALTNALIEKMKGELPELLKLEKERDEEYLIASDNHKYHPSEKTLTKMKSLEESNGAYNSGVRQGKIEILTTQITHLTEYRDYLMQ